MTTQRCTFDEIVQTLHGKLALDNHRRIRFHHEIHMLVRFRTLELRFRECPHTRENEVVAHRFDFHAVSERIQVAHDFLEIRGGQIDDGGIFHVGNHQFLGIGLNESQLVVVGLPYIAVVKLHPQIGDDSVLVILLVNVHRESVVVGQRGNQFEEVHGVCTNHDFVGHAAIHLKLVGVEDDADQHGVGLVKVDDAHPLFSKSDGGVGQDIL